MESNNHMKIELDKTESPTEEGYYLFKSNLSRAYNPQVELICLQMFDGVLCSKSGVQLKLLKGKWSEKIEVVK